MEPIQRTKRKILSPLDKKPIEIKREAVEDELHVQNDDKLIDHLSELRNQLIKSIFIFLLFLIIVFLTMNKWFPLVTKGNELVVFGPFQIVKFYTSISVTLALGLSLPFLIHFMWQFVKPGLKTNEVRYLGLYSPIMFLLFIIGVAFGYFVINPLSYRFLMNFGSMNFEVIISAQEYVHFLIMTTIPIGFLFELPAIAMFLASIGVLTTETMKNIRKWSYLVIAILSALITPPDFISQLMVLIPMALLYEISIYIVNKMEKRQGAEQPKVVTTD
ncbi:twin-arginine translocase subunit TatC [Pseudogracilibacillus sp. SO30301A]|uniref:twin-arginine translocase subunit TatC n=1 Tax=Pseudogracilibacillus sp. SO30301A TaxID=3098291 RepID=UPI00300E4688